MKNKFTSFLLSVLLIGTPLAAQDFKIHYGPYLQNVGENEVTVVWVTSADALGWVETAPDDGTSFYAETRPQHFQTENGKKLIGRVHKVTVKGLERGSSYIYRVYSREVLESSNQSVLYGNTVATDGHRDPFKFRTLDPSKDETRFTVINDIHGNSKKLETLIKNTGNDAPDFVMYNGDMMGELESEELMFEGFINTSVDMFASRYPFFMVRGNHEDRGAFSTEYMKYFPSSTGKPYYHFRHGPAFFIVLDSGEDKPDSDKEYHGLAAWDSYRQEQIEWLQDVIGSEEFKRAPQKIVFIHIPAFTSDWYGTREVDRLFYPPLNDAGVDFMFCGHLHRHVFLPVGEKGNVFPILTNSSNEVFDVTVDKEKITIKIIDLEGKTTDVMEF